ncbi:MAG TPA: peptide deformylase [Candidatus Moranbacteria bacterium]|nr:peptide deformylase [Candidatus Moranbacteria bacterium]
MKLKIRKYPDPVLSQKAAKIKDPLNKEVQELIENMTETLHANKNGVGLAAPQVGVSVRLCIIELEDIRYILINPKITAKSRQKEVCDEGCLSFPGEFYPVSRYSEVQVRYTDEKGQPAKVKTQGLLARAMQHEIDHLDGILFISKTKKLQKILNR